MHIIFDDHVDKVKDRFTVLELDTFRVPEQDRTVKTWCVVETVPFTEIPIIDQLSQLHDNLMRQYRDQWCGHHWNQRLVEL